MSTNFVVSVEAGGFTLTDRPQRPRTVAEALHSFDTVRDVTVVVAAQGSNDRMLIALDSGRVFLGLEHRSGVYEFARKAGSEAKVRMRVAGQDTELEDRYILDLRAAAFLVEHWIMPGMATDLGTWQPR